MVEYYPVSSLNQVKIEGDTGMGMNPAVKSLSRGWWMKSSGIERQKTIVGLRILNAALALASLENPA